MITSPLLTALSKPPIAIPKRVSGAVLWLDATDTSTITQVSSDVSEWRDKSGNEFALAQGTGSEQPLYEPAGFNGKPCITFADNETKRLLEIGVPQLQTFTIFASVIPTGNSSYKSIFLIGDEIWFRLKESDSAPRLFVRDGVGFSSAAEGVAIANGTPQIVACSYNGTIAKIRQDGAETESRNLNKTIQSASTTLAVGFTLGGGFKIQELIAYEGVLTAAETALVENYMSQNSGVSI